MTTTLARAARGRDNNFNLIRFCAAALVLVSHSWPLSNTPGEPLERFAGFSFGHLAVDVFFAVSGFLVTGSLLGKRRLGPFLRARALRIFPALVASSLVTAFVIGVLQTSLDPLAYFRRVETWRYALQNATCWPWPVRYELPGAFAQVPVARVVNGSLWSLPFELSMYVGLAVIGLLAYTGPRLLKERAVQAIVFGIAACSLAGYTANEAFEFASGFTTVQTLRLTALFATGATFYLLREHIPLHPFLALTAATGFLAALAFGHGWMVLYVLGLQYLVLWLAYVPAGRVRRYNALGDYSYGFYLWAFPIQQCVMAWRPGSSRLALTVLAALPTLALAVASWHLLESPMLALKDRLARPAPAPPANHADVTRDA